MGMLRRPADNSNSHSNPTFLIDVQRVENLISQVEIVIRSMVTARTTI